MNLLSGLEKFGLDQMDTDHLFEEEKSDTPARKAPEPVPKKEPVHSETEFLLDKSIRCQAVAGSHGFIQLIQNIVGCILAALFYLSC